jgi:hypothetical protein
MSAHVAADRLMVMTKKAGLPPRQRDSAGSHLLDEIFNIGAFPRTLPASSIGLIQDWLNSSLRTGNLYLTAGMDTPGNKINDAARTSIAQQNIITYGPEVGRYFDATLQLTNELDETMFHISSDHQNQITQTEEQLKDVITKETTVILTNVLDAMAMPNISNQWRNERMGELKSLGSGAARFLLSPEQRRSVQQAAEAAENATSDHDLKEKLIDFSLWFREPVILNR